MWNKLVRMFHPDLHEHDPEKRMTYEHEHLQARILEMIETLDEVRASADYEVFRAAAEDESVIGRIVSTQREELELELDIGELKVEAEKIAGEARELVGEVPF